MANPSVPGPGGVSKQGPWPVGEPQGQYFDDGKFANVKQIQVHLDNDEFVSGIQFEYMAQNGASQWKPVHGGIGKDVNGFGIEPDDFLTRMKVCYGPLDEVFSVKSLTFLTNKGYTYGPLGREIGEGYWCPVDRTGFYGWADTEHLYCIGAQ